MGTFRPLEGQGDIGRTNSFGNDGTSRVTQIRVGHVVTWNEAESLTFTVPISSIFVEARKMTLPNLILALDGLLTLTVIKTNIMIEENKFNAHLNWQIFQAAESFEGTVSLETTIKNGNVTQYWAIELGIQ